MVGRTEAPERDLYLQKRGQATRLLINALSQDIRRTLTTEFTQLSPKGILDYLESQLRADTSPETHEQLRMRAETTTYQKSETLVW